MLQLFQQKGDRDYDVVSSNFEVRQSTKPIVYLDTLPRDKDARVLVSVELLAVHKDGEISCYTEGLDQEIWSARAVLDDHAEGDMWVKHARIISVSEAQTALLKGREDIIESLGGSSNLETHRLLLVLIQSGKNHTSTLKLLNLESSDHHNLRAKEHKILPEILSIPISSSIGQDKEVLQTYFHVASGILYQNTPSDLFTHDLSGGIPRAGQTTPLGNGTTSSCIRISPSLIATSNNNSFSILDMRYITCQGQLTLPKHKKPRQSVESNKDVETYGTQSPILVLLSYVSSRNIVVALYGRELKAFQLATPPGWSSGSRKRKRDGLLIDSIGRGLPASKRKFNSTKSANSSSYDGLSPLYDDVDDVWRERKSEMDEYLADGKILELERLLYSDIVSYIQADKAAPPSSTTRAKHNPRKVQYLISRIFNIENDGADVAIEAGGTSKRLKVAKSVHSILPLLFNQGRLSDYHVEIALKHEGSILSSDHIKPGSVVQALADWDTSLQTLLDYLDGPAPFPAIQTVHVLRYAILKDGQSGLSNGMKLLTYGEYNSDENVHEKATHDPNSKNHTDSSKMQGDAENPIGRILRVSLKRLYHCPVFEVTKALRSILSRSEIRTLIDMLRINIARNGWLTPYGEEAQAQEYQEDSPISVIAHLLSCAIDSIGTGGWIMGSSLTDDLIETAETIAYMKAEISAALEGIEEATYLRGMLGEMLLCGKSFKNRYPDAYRQRDVKNERSKPTIVSVGEGGDNTLPLGLKTHQDISKYKIGAGGELIRRSARDIGRLKSRMVPKYSFERIMI